MAPSFLPCHTSPWASILSVLSRQSSNVCQQVTPALLTTFVATEHLPQPRAAFVHQTVIIIPFHRCQRDSVLDSLAAERWWLEAFEAFTFFFGSLTIKIWRNNQSAGCLGKAIGSAEKSWKVTIRCEEYILYICSCNGLTLMPMSVWWSLLQVCLNGTSLIDLSNKFVPFGPRCTWCAG
jgi:hypothetical protein